MNRIGAQNQTAQCESDSVDIFGNGLKKWIWESSLTNALPFNSCIDRSNTSKHVAGYFCVWNCYAARIKSIRSYVNGKISGERCEELTQK